MFFDFEDYRPDIQPIGRAISWREGVLLAFIVHLIMVIVLLLAPRLFPFDPEAARARALMLQPREEPRRFVFVQPRLDMPALRPPDRAEDSDKNRVARAPARAPNPADPLPLARGNSPERVETVEPQAARGRGPAPDSAAGLDEERRRQAEASQLKLPDRPLPLMPPEARPPTARNGASGTALTPGGTLGDAVRNLRRYLPETFDNPHGGGGQFGPEIQFDTKGVEFGPWIRRFVAQVKRNWLIPYAAMMSRGHVVITFNVHKDGTITDLEVVGPCPIDAFNNAAFGALKGSNPTEPLPPDYPSESAFFTVTFFYNEVPPR